MIGYSYFMLRGFCMSNSCLSCNFVKGINSGDTPDTSSYVSIFKQYEEVIISAIVTSFGLDFLIQDRHGGDVDTVHNVRQIGTDPEMTYKNQKNASDYANRGAYNSAEYHSHPNYRNEKHNKRKEYFENGNKSFKDEYTGKINLHFFGKSKNASSEKRANLEHVISTKLIHDDRGRVLAGIDGKEIANSPFNLVWTNEKLNKSMKADEIPDYIAAHPELDEQTKKNMLEFYEKAKRAYDTEINDCVKFSSQF